MVKKLTREDMEIVLDCWTHSKPVWGQPPVLDRKSYVEKCFEDELNEIYGFFDESKRLVLTAGIRTWTSYPCYTILNFKSRDLLDYRAFKVGFSQLFGSFLMDLEARGYREFWYAIEYKGAYERIWKRKNILNHLVEGLKNYHFFTEKIVEPNQPVEWPLYQSFLANNSIAIPVAIRRAIHKSKLLLGEDEGKISPKF